jgi:hypothetical protein
LYMFMTSFPLSSFKVHSNETTSQFSQIYVNADSIIRFAYGKFAERRGWRYVKGHTELVCPNIICNQSLCYDNTTSFYPLHLLLP